MRFVDGSPEKNDKQLSVSSDDAINEKYAYSDHCSLNLVGIDGLADAHSGVIGRALTGDISRPTC
jgi:hypothetical protein